MIEIESDRFHFVEQRDGINAACVFARQSIHAYRMAALALKRKHGKRANYRREWLESALSFRAIIRGAQ